jgi:hypothetical protein
MKFPHQLFKRAGLNSTDIANLFGVSRVTGARWLSGVDRAGNPGVGVNKFLEREVTRIHAALAKAVAAGRLPSEEVSSLPPKRRLAKLRSILKQSR